MIVVLLVVLGISDELGSFGDAMVVVTVEALDRTIGGAGAGAGAEVVVMEVVPMQAPSLQFSPGQYST